MEQEHSVKKSSPGSKSRDGKHQERSVSKASDSKSRKDSKYDRADSEGDED